MGRIVSETRGGVVNPSAGGVGVAERPRTSSPADRPMDDPRDEDEDVLTVTDFNPFDFTATTGAAAVSVFPANIAAASVVRAKCLNATTGAPANATWSVNFGAGAVTITAACILLQQSTGGITAVTVTQSSGSTCRISGVVAGA